MSRYIAVQNLALELTRKCNLNCGHCVRGRCQNVEMPDEIIDKVFSEVDKVGGLSFIGGETSLCADKLNKVYESLKAHKTEVDGITIFTNAVDISPECIQALKNLESLAMVNDKGVRGLIKSGVYKDGDFPLQVIVSLDKFHLEAMEKAGIDKKKVKANIEELAKHFPVEIDKTCNFLLFNVGNARNVTDTYKTSISAYKTAYLYGCNTKTGNSLLLVGPHVAVSAYGKIVDCNTTYIKADAPGYSYGDVLEKGFYESIKEKLKAEKCKRVYSYNKFFRTIGKYMDEFRLTNKDINNIIRFNKARGQAVNLYPLTKGAVPSLEELDKAPETKKQAPSV